MMSENERLQQAIKESVEKQTLYLEAENVEIPESNASKCRTLVSTGRSFETASRYARNGKKVCVLNFASATNPGGGVVHGSSAQEESLCRCSTLYPCLDIDKMWQEFYTPHRRAGNPAKHGAGQNVHLSESATKPTDCGIGKPHQLVCNPAFRHQLACQNKERNG